MSISKVDRDKLIVANRGDMVEAVDIATAAVAVADQLLVDAEHAAMAVVRSLNIRAMQSELSTTGWVQVDSERWALPAGQYVDVRTVRPSTYGQGFSVWTTTYRLSDGMQKGKRSECNRIDIKPIQAALYVPK